MVVLGVVNALMPPEMAVGPGPDEVSMMEATAGARQPAWFLSLNRLIGAVGVWFGSRKLRAQDGSRKTARPPRPNGTGRRGGK